MKKEDEKSKFSLIAPAKINLCLRVLGKRADGYHDLQSLMVPLSIGDTLEFEIFDSPSLVWDATSDHPEVPVDADSLVGRAFRMAAEDLGFKGGARLSLTKRIPMGAGLGGGSSDAATVMRAVERVTNRRLRQSSYPEIAFQIGADVPFFLTDGAKWVGGVGEQVQRIEKIPALQVLLVNPGLHIATKWVYQNLDLGRLTTKESIANLPKVFSSMADLFATLTNDLESVVLPKYPIVAEIKQKILALGGDAALMSGSGSTVFGLFSDPEKLKRAEAIFKKDHSDWWVCSSSVGGNSGVV